MSHVNYVSNILDGCASVHLKQLYSLHKRAIKSLMPTLDTDYIRKCHARRLVPLDKKKKKTAIESVCSNAKDCSR